MKRGKLQGKLWDKTANRCHERWNGDRCQRQAGHTIHVPSKNEELEQLNGWHQSRSGCWKDNVFLTWKEFEAFRCQVTSK